jgi:hypothetical protein
MPLHRDRFRLPLVRVRAAAEVDLLGRNVVDIGTSLGRVDSPPAWEHFRESQPPTSRTAREYAKAGRRLLAQVGAWPWCVAIADDGRLPAEWWTRCAFDDALRTWIEDSATHTVIKLMQTLDEAHGSARLWYSPWLDARALVDEMIAIVSPPPDRGLGCEP